METIKAYKLSNGEIVENINEAIAKEKIIKFEENLWDLVNNNVAYTDYKETTFEFIKNHKDKLLKILEDAK